MQNANLFTRSDTVLGACEGIGEDFGFNAQYLRIALAGMLFWSPVAAVGTYAVLAVAVFVSRKLDPVAARHADAAEPAVTAAPVLAAPGNDVAPALAVAA